MPVLIGIIVCVFLIILRELEKSDTRRILDKAKDMSFINKGLEYYQRKQQLNREFNMTREEYKKKINEIKKQKDALDVQIEQVHKEFRDSLLRELEEQAITPGTKVSVKTKKWNGDEIDTETYFFDVSLIWGKMEYVFHKIKKDGTMSQINQYIEGTIISIHKI